MSERFLLLMFCIVAASASAAGVLALDHYGVVQIEVAQSPQMMPGFSERAPKSDMMATDALLAEPASAETVVVASADAAAMLPQADPLTDLHDQPSAAPLMSNAQAHVGADSDPMAAVGDTEEDMASEDAEFWSAETKSAVDDAKRSASASLTGPRVSALEPQRLEDFAALPKKPAVDVSLEKRLAEISPTATKRLDAKFGAVGASFPPADIGLVALKDEKVLELYARQKGGQWTFIHSYPVLAASGVSGPKLRQGDKQVPEGVYQISFLNPNSRYHVSLRVNYPNSFDRQMAQADGRKDLGGDIMIHGKAVSVGCLAIGDEAAEELFVLAARAGLKNIKLVIAPTDFRHNAIPEHEAGKPVWLSKLYPQVASAMSEFKAPPKVGLLSLFSKW